MGRRRREPQQTASSVGTTAGRHSQKREGTCEETRQGKGNIDGDIFKVSRVFLLVSAIPFLRFITPSHSLGQLRCWRPAAGRLS